MIDLALGSRVLETLCLSLAAALSSEGNGQLGRPEPADAAPSQGPGS